MKKKMIEHLDMTGVLKFIDENSDTLAAQANLYASPEFLSLYVRHFPARSYYAGRFGDAVVLMQDQAALSNYYVEQAFVAGSESEDIDEVIRHAFREVTGPVMRFQPLADTGPFEALPGWYTRTFDVHENWYLPCLGLSYDAYIQKRPELARTKQRKKFPGTFVIETDLERAITDYNAVYASSWKKPEPTNFIDDLMRMCHRMGWLRVGVSRLGDEPIAAQIWIVRDDIAYIYKVAYNEALKKHSAGTLLMGHMMKHVLDEDKVHEVDFGQGGDPYKQQWMSHMRRRKGVVMCRLASPKGLVRAAWEKAGAVRQAMRA